MIKGYFPLDKSQIMAAEKYGININGKPRDMSMDLLDKRDKIIVVADDIPEIIFNYIPYKKKTAFWKIPDSLENDNIEKDKKIVRMVMKKVDTLIKSLENKNDN